MSSGPTSRLPDGVEDVLPEEARILEDCRRRALDRCVCWGYQLVVPPLVEYPEDHGLGGAALSAQTFRFPDPHSGNTLGLRADMTPQAARMDRQYFPQDLPVRLCYAGTVLRTHPEMLGGSRSPIQAGAELYGDEGPESDAEIVLLLCDVLRAAGCRPWCLGLGHAGVFHALTEDVPWSAQERGELFSHLQRKADADISAWLDAHPVDPDLVRALRALPSLCGSGEEVLDRIVDALAPCNARIPDLLDEVRMLAAQVRTHHPDAELHFDVSEAHGFRYENGIVFAAYVDGEGQEIARGGRYSAGAERPATGFSLDLRVLSRCRGRVPDEEPRIFAPGGSDPELAQAVARLRDDGRVVVRALQEGDAAHGLGCTEVLVAEQGSWVVRPETS